MESLLLGLFLLLSVPITAVKEHHRRQARSILNLVGMIRCSTSRSISYLMYGCYCGIGGKGWPRDDTDWCCHAHDCCYGRAESAGCHPKSDHYNWVCRYKIPKCGYVYNNCERMICECDVQFSNCLKTAAYNTKNALWPNFMCGKKRPHCNYY
uniref:group 10 secretory phospholipase A2 isoform X2 n=1 Tax=Pristiophorus japonicus TaxID=55135 RepID=UPI00398E8D9E